MKKEKGKIATTEDTEDTEINRLRIENEKLRIQLNVLIDITSELIANKRPFPCDIVKENDRRWVLKEMAYRTDKFLNKPIPPAIEFPRLSEAEASDLSIVNQDEKSALKEMDGQ